MVLSAPGGLDEKGFNMANVSCAAENMLLAAAGLVLALCWITAPRWLTAGIYIFMGWLAVVALVPLLRLLPPAGFFWVLGGGILYTVGGVLYAVKWPGRDNPRFGCHEIFHLFILMGSVFHFMLMYRVVAFL